MYVWWVCLVLKAGLVVCSQHVPGYTKLLVPEEVTADDGVKVLVTSKDRDFNLTCISYGVNHTWHFEPAEFYNDLKDKMEIKYQYQSQAEGPLINSTLSVFNASYLNTGNYSCGVEPFQQSVSVFVRDPENLFIVEGVTTAESGDTLDYLCRPTDPSMSVDLNIEYDNFPINTLEPGVRYEYMDVQYSKYRGYTLTNILFDGTFHLYCNFIDSYVYSILIENPPQIDGPEITVSPSTTVVGSNITLKCTIENYLRSSSIVLKWILPDPKLNQSGSFEEEQQQKKKQLHTSNLIISNAKMSYSGNYTCIVEYKGSPYKISTKSLSIIDRNVLNLALISEELTQVDPPEIDVELGAEKQELSVKIISYPPVTKTTWFHEDQQIYDNQSSYRIHNSDGLVSLEIKEPKPKHSGLYILQVENPKLNKTINLTLFVKDLVGVDSPNAIILEGDDVSISCGVPKFKSNGTDLDWWWTSNHVTEKCLNTLRETTTYTHRVTLNMANVTTDNSGNYTCQERKTVIGSYQMDVKEPIKPKIKSSKAVIQVKPEDRITLNCNTSGVPEPNVYWFKDSKPVSLNEVELSNENQTLYFPKGINMSTNLTCVAESRVGNANHTYFISVEEKIIPEDYEEFYFLFIAVLITILLFITILYCIREYKFKKEIKELRKFLFNDGKIEAINPELDIRDQAELLPYNPEFEFPRDKLKLDYILGSGAFGVVMKAKAFDLSNPGEVTTVAVKMAKPNAHFATVKSLASELKIMIHIGKHLNVVNLLGACTSNIYKRELFVLVEYCQYGNLHTYLLKHKGTFINQVNPRTGTSYCTDKQHTSLSCSSSVFSDADDVVCKFNKPQEKVLLSTATDSTLLSSTDKPSFSSEDSFPVVSTSCSGDTYLVKQCQQCKSSNQNTCRSLCTQDLMSWSLQIARGMEYLNSKKVVHGDLAARNVLLADNNIVKICDFGLSRSMYKDCYKKTGDDPLPVKWMALESILYGLFSSQSDVWSYGVTLWELFSLARSPYSDIDSYKDLVKKLEHGYRMDQPKYATTHIYKIMQDCWSNNPFERPSFSQLTERLSKLLENLVSKQYLEINDTSVEENSEVFCQQIYPKLPQPSPYINLSAQCVLEPDESTPMMGNSNMDIILVNNLTYNRVTQLNEYVDMKSPTTKGKFDIA